MPLSKCLYRASLVVSIVISDVRGSDSNSVTCVNPALDSVTSQPPRVVVAESRTQNEQSDSQSPRSPYVDINYLESRESLFTREHIASFRENGFLVASGLLDSEIQDLVAASDSFLANAEKKQAYFSTVEMGMIFKAGGSSNSTITNSFRRVALESSIPQGVAELMELPAETHNVRVLRDVFMAKSIHTDSTCDWHVDDVGFWPESYVSEREGINVWIAMEDMPASYQGSMALSPGSHTADWRFDAYEAIGQNRTYHGGITKEETKRRAKAGEKLLTTCEMRHQAPELRERIEETIFIPEIKKGDVIFATRSLFHRTVKVTEDGKKFYESRGIEHLNRYSIRYVPGTAQLPQGWTFEWSIANNAENAGRRIDHAMERDDLLWYPQVWPKLDPHVGTRLDTVANTKFDESKAKVRSEVFELISMFMPTTA